MSFINDNFMLKNDVAKALYNEVKDLPIIDYHCHISPKMIAENYKFKNAYELFLGGDHYKWRQMRTNGVDEEYITGSASDYDKWLAFAKTMPYLIGNPLYHWTHLELKRYFGIDEILSEKTAKSIWDRVNKCLENDEFTTQGLIKRSNVEVICTTKTADASGNVWAYIKYTYEDIELKGFCRIDFLKLETDEEVESTETTADVPEIPGAVEG